MMNTRRSISLHVHVVVESSPSGMTVDVRVCGDTVKVGDLFRAAFRHLRPKTLDGYAHLRPPMAQRHVSLRITSMMAYRKDFQELDSGMTGRIRLEGVGSDMVIEGDVLGSEFTEG